MKKQERHQLIKKIIEKHHVSTQKDLMNILKERGIAVTQTTLSRDMKALRVSSIPHPEKGHIYSLPMQITTFEGLPAKNHLPNEMVQSIAFSSNLAVLKCAPSFAPSIATILDTQGMNEILGTIAGDDTVLIILNEGVSQNVFKKEITARFPNLNHVFVNSGGDES